MQKSIVGHFGVKTVYFEAFDQATLKVKRNRHGNSRHTDDSSKSRQLLLRRPKWWRKKFLLGTALDELTTTTSQTSSETSEEVDSNLYVLEEWEIEERREKIKKKQSDPSDLLSTKTLLSSRFKNSNVRSTNRLTRSVAQRNLKNKPWGDAANSQNSFFSKDRTAKTVRWGSINKSVSVHRARSDTWSSHDHVRTLRSNFENSTNRVSIISR